MAQDASGLFLPRNQSRVKNPELKPSFLKAYLIKRLSDEDSRMKNAFQMSYHNVRSIGYLRSEMNPPPLTNTTELKCRNVILRMTL